MDKKQYLPHRKENRLKRYSYDRNGVYFITVCMKDRRRILGTLVENNADESACSVGGGVPDAPKIRLSRYGKDLEEQLRRMNDIYSNIKVHKYVIMPDHIHLLLRVQKHPTDGASGTPPPTGERSFSAARANEIVPRFVSTLKRFCNKRWGVNLFQRSYYDHVIRDTEDYNSTMLYMANNPRAWEYKHK